MMEKSSSSIRSSSSSSAAFVALWSVVLLSANILQAEGEHFFPRIDEQHYMVPRESRRSIASSEFGAITAVDVNVAKEEKGPYHLQFITLDTSSLFLPVLLHADMVFYVHTGRGTVTWVSDEKSNSIEVERGDVYRIEEGNVFYVQSHSNATREKLRIHAIFNTITDENPLEGFVGPYSNISDLVRGFSDKVLQMGFRVSEDVTKGIKWVERPPPIVQFQPKNETDEESNWKDGIFEALLGRKHSISLNKGKKTKKSKTKTYNLYNRKPDVKNCNGWSIAVTNKDFKPLRDSDIGVFMVNLTRGAMMGPHWNPRATEIAIVIHGEGMVQFVCPSAPSGEMSQQFKCQNETFKVKEGDVFVVPRFHPMAQIAFNNDSFVFMGFTTSVSRNHPQYLAGKMSVLRVIDREVLAMSFNTANASTLDRFLDSQEESIMLECTSCAEELARKMEEEIERRQEEEARRREEEEAKKREEEEAKRRQEEEEARKREEEEEAKKREEEEAKRRQEEEEEEARKREEEEAKRRQEEEKARKREEEEEAKKREEEEAKRRQEEEEARKREEEEARREEEEEEARKREEEEARRKEEEEARREEEEEEEARRKEEEEDARRREEEEEEEEEAAAAPEKARKRGEKEARRREEEEEEEAAAARRREQEGGEGRKEEDEARRREEEEEEARRREAETAARMEQAEVTKGEEEEQQPPKGSWACV